MAGRSRRWHRSGRGRCGGGCFLGVGGLVGGVGRVLFWGLGWLVGWWGGCAGRVVWGRAAVGWVRPGFWLGVGRFRWRGPGRRSRLGAAGGVRGGWSGCR